MTDENSVQDGPLHDPRVTLGSGALGLFESMASLDLRPEEVKRVSDVAGLMRQRREANRQRGATDLASFVLDLPDELPAIWGTGEKPAWVEGEGLMLVGPQGVGKTTIAQQLVLALAGLKDEVLGMPVKPVKGTILYLALDRPAQIARSWSRMLDAADREAAARVKVWQGPLDFNIVSNPSAVAAFVRDDMGASVVVVDSYKDLAPDLSNEVSGFAINVAMQECLAEGIQWVGLHHHRKGTADNPTPKTLADVFGSTWLTAGIGSVLGIGGDPGAELVEVRHLKQPAESLGRFGVRHDHRNGASELADELPVRTTARQGTTQTRRDDIAKLLKTDPEKTWITKDLIDEMGVSRPVIQGDMGHLVKEGLAEVVQVAGSNTNAWKAASETE